MLLKSLFVLALVSACAFGRSIDEVIRDASKNATNTLKHDEILVEMDMRYTREDWERVSSGIDGHKGIRGDRYRWTNKHVPYIIDPRAFDSNDKNKIRNALDEWEKYTCLTFAPRKSEKNYVYIQDDNSGCNSYVGMMNWGSQPMNLAKYGCVWHATIVHEFGHAIGFQHEHQRPERDTYVQIQWSNVGKGWESAFTKFPASGIDNRGVAYDYLSVMHYGKTAFSHNNRDITIRTIDSAYQDKIGNGPGLSFADIKLANMLYSCDDKCGDVKCGADGFVGKDCKCWCDNKSWSNRLCECGSEGCGDGGGDDGGIACIDENTQCSYWASIGECEKNPRYMLYSCAKSCKICGDNAGCKDYDTNCSGWTTKGYCTSGEYVDFMKRHCRSSCKFC